MQACVLRKAWSYGPGLNPQHFKVMKLAQEEALGISILNRQEQHMFVPQMFFVHPLWARHSPEYGPGRGPYNLARGSYARVGETENRDVSHRAGHDRGQQRPHVVGL